MIENVTSLIDIYCVNFWGVWDPTVPAPLYLAIYSVSQKIPPEVFWHFSQTVRNF